MAYAPCGSQHKDAVQITLEQIDLIKRFIEQYKDNLQYVTSSQGKISFLFPLLTYFCQYRYWLFKLHSDVGKR